MTMPGRLRHSAAHRAVAPIAFQRNEKIREHFAQQREEQERHQREIISIYLASGACQLSVYDQCWRDAEGRIFAKVLGVVRQTEGPPLEGTDENVQRWKVMAASLRNRGFKFPANGGYDA